MTLLSTHESPDPRPSIELRHLRIFLAMYKLRSVSKTAELLGTMQPSISVALSRLRAHYNDPLFVRTGQTMRPTDRADLLAPSIEDALRILEDAETRTPVFDPATAERPFTLALADAGKIVVLPTIAGILESSAPGITLRVQNITMSTPEALESEDVDLAFGFMPPRRSGLYNQSLFQDRFVCIASGNTKLELLTRNHYEMARHVVIEESISSTPVFKKLVEQNRILLKVAMSVPTPFGLGEVIAATDLLATVPYRMAQALCKTQNLAIFRLPFEDPVYDIGQHWHGRVQHDEGHKWLRRSIYEAFNQFRAAWPVNPRPGERLAEPGTHRIRKIE